MIRRFNNRILEIGAKLTTSQDIMSRLSRNYCYMDIHGIPSTLIGTEWNTHLNSHLLYSGTLKTKCALYKTFLTNSIKRNIYPTIKKIIGELNIKNEQNPVIDAFTQLSIDKITEKPITELDEFGKYSDFIDFIDSQDKNQQKSKWNDLKKYVGVYFYLYHPVYNIQSAIYNHTKTTNVNGTSFIDFKNYTEFCKYLSEDFATRDIHFKPEYMTIFNTVPEKQIFNNKYFDFNGYLDLFKQNKNPYIGVDKININLGQSELKTKPSYEIYIRLDYVGGIISHTNEDLAKCMYSSNRLGSMYNILFISNAFNNTSSETAKVNSQYVDITEELKNAVQRRNAKKNAKINSDTKQKPNNTSDINKNKQPKLAKGDRNLSVDDISLGFSNSNPVEKQSTKSIDEIIQYNSNSVEPMNPEKFREVINNEFGNVFDGIKDESTTNKITDRLNDAIGKAQSESNKLSGRLENEENTTMINVYDNIAKLFKNMLKTEGLKQRIAGGSMNKKRVTRKRRSTKRNRKTIRIKR